MTVINPPVFLNDASVSYTADDVRRLVDALTGGRTGILFPGDLAPTQRPTPDMQVRIAGGRAFIANSLDANAGVYMVDNQGNTDVTIQASESQPRYDRIIAEVQDAQYSGASNQWRLHVVKGTAAASPTEPSLAAFNNYIEIARITVGASVTSITNASISDRRVSGAKGQAATLGGVIVTTSASRPTTNLYEGLRILETDTNREMVYNGSAWVGAGAYGAPPPQFFSDTLNNGTATTFTAFATHTGILIAPYPLTMVVRVAGDWGFNGSANRAHFAIWDESNNYITQGPGLGWGGAVTHDFNSTGLYRQLAAIGKKDYAAGASCGYKLAYAVNTSNVYVGAGVEVVFIPKVS